MSHSKTTHKTHHYSCDDVDFFVGVDLRTLEVYIIPITKISRSSKKINQLQKYKENYLLEPCCGNAISASPQVGETFNNGNTELVSETLKLCKRCKAIFAYKFHQRQDICDSCNSVTSVETLRETSKVNNYDEDKVQTTNYLESKAYGVNVIDSPKKFDLV